MEEVLVQAVTVCLGKGNLRVLEPEVLRDEIVCPPLGIDSAFEEVDQRARVPHPREVQMLPYTVIARVVLRNAQCEEDLIKHRVVQQSGLLVWSQHYRGRCLCS